MARAVSELTGRPLIGAPRRRLMAAMAKLDPQTVIAELRRMPSPTFLLCVARVEELAEEGSQPQGERNSARLAEQERLRRLVEEYQEAGELEEAAFYRSRLVAVGGK